ncbi:hypothetical protein BT69DRAFT_1273239 [Atractiella rhizophila]|nr:hypothetical protein BT69DRAFT_1273239 [Atractiella rhizophila]
MRGKFEEVSVEEILQMLPAPKPEEYSESRPPPRPIQISLPVSNESELYSQVITGLDRYLARDWHWVDTSALPDKTIHPVYDYTAVKPDLVLYSAEAVAVEGNSMRDVDMFAELKTEKILDAFDSKRSPFERDSKVARDIRGQITVYNTVIQTLQHRTCVFSFSLHGAFARLIVHSRAGSKVSRSFDVRFDNSLSDYIDRYTHAPPDRRGYDLTFTPAGCDSAAKEARRFLQVDDDTPLFKVWVGRESFYISQPFTSSHFLAVGRGTKCYRAYLFKRKEIVLLKDTWRKMEYQKEGTIYAHLHDRKIPNIATVLVDQDVETKNPLQEAIGAGGFRMKHYRIVLNEVGEPLSNFRSSWELVKVLLDAFTAHQQAVQLANLLHRDVSVGNVLLLRTEGGEARGMLIDWEFAKGIDDVSARLRERTGTYQFLSLRLIQKPRVKHCVADDIESFVYVLLWLTVNCGPVRLTEQERRSYLKTFDRKENNQDAWVSKFGLINQARNFAVIPPTLRGLIVRLLDTLSTAVEFQVALDRIAKAKEDEVPGSVLDDEDTESLKKMLMAFAAMELDGEDPEAVKSMENELTEQEKAWNLFQFHDYVRSELERALQDEKWKETTDGARFLVRSE